METKWIEDFLLLAETGSFSRSAAARNVTQPAFSRRIKMLETWLGGQLVDRSTYPTTLTSAGLAFRDGAQSMLRELYALREQVRAESGVSADTVTFAVLHSLSVMFLPKWLKSVGVSNEGRKLQLKSDNFHDCVHALVEESCDFLLTFSHPRYPVLANPERYPSVTLGATRLIPVSIPDRHGRPRFRLPGTKDSPVDVLTYSPDSYLGRIVDESLMQHRLPCQLNRCYEDSMAVVLKSLALEGHGLTWQPVPLVEDELANGWLVTAGDETWGIPLEIRLWRTPDRSSEAANAIWEAAQTVSK